MEWTKENILEFIDLYKETTVLWDPKDPFHYNKVKKNEAWEDIAREIGRSAEECRKKMEYLLAALRREKMKIKSSIVKGKDHKITWFAFDSLKFLFEERRARRGTEIVPISDITFNSTDERDFDEDSSIVMKHGHDYADNFNTKTGTGTPSQQQSSAKRPRLDVVATDSSSASASNAEIAHFANYISTKLESYSARTRSAVQHAISNLLFVADLGQFDYLGQLPREKGNGGGNGNGGGPSQRLNTQNSAHQQQRSQSTTPVPAAASSSRSAKVTRASAAAAAASASSSHQADHEVSVSQTQSYQELFDSNNFEDDDAIDKKEMDEGHQQVEIIVA